MRDPIEVKNETLITLESFGQRQTRPVGSTPPGMAHGSNHPSEILRAPAQRSRTSTISAGASSLDISPRRSRLLGLSCFQVLKMGIGTP